MEILHFEDLGDTESVVMNEVVLVLGDCQVYMATCLRGYLPSYKVVGDITSDRNCLHIS